MLLREKYSPDSFEEFGSKYTYLNNLPNIPHTIIYGKHGCGKSTLINLILKKIYGITKLKLSKNITELKMNNNKVIELSVFYSNIHYIINPSLYGLYDKVILLNFLKDISSNTDIKKFISNKNSTKIIVIKNAEYLSKNAQNALRSIMESNNDNFRIVFLVSSLNRIIEPIISRCMLIKITIPNNNDIFNIIKNISIKEDIPIEDDFLKNIIKICNGNIKKTINYLDYYSTSNNNENKLDDSYISIKKLVNLIYTSEINNIPDIRNIIYNLFISFNKPLDIINQIYLIIEEDILDIKNKDDNYKNHILLEINIYLTNLSSMLNVANKPIIYFENFIYFLFKLFNKYKVSLY
jgi:replication factor C subunit 3/5